MSAHIPTDEYNEKISQFIAASLTGNISRTGSRTMPALTIYIVDEAQAAMEAYKQLRRDHHK